MKIAYYPGCTLKTKSQNLEVPGIAAMAALGVELEEDTADCVGEDRAHREAELKMTNRLVDLVLYLYYRLDPKEGSRVEVTIIIQNNDIYLLPNFQQFIWMVNSSPGNICNMNKTINPT